MAIPELGTKQICPNCQAKFYDLGKRPAHCPKCASDFDPDELVRSRRVRARAIVPDTDDEAEDQIAAKAKDAEDDEEEEEAVTPELDEVVDDPPLAADDDDDTVEPGVSPVADDEFSDDEEVEADDDVPFLEEEEDDDFDDSEIEGLPEEGDAEDR